MGKTVQTFIAASITALGFLALAIFTLYGAIITRGPAALLFYMIFILFMIIMSYCIFIMYWMWKYF